MEIVLHWFPITCSKVPLILLEEIGAPFETKLVRFMTGEQKSPEYKRLNPKGKVPAIVIDGEALSENVAIALHLDLLFPDARLLPETDALGRARQIADLCFCAATLHPFVTRICVPQMMADEPGVASVRRKAMEGIREYLQIAEDRLGEGPWWYGDAWSAMDPYLYWVFWRIGMGSDFDRSGYPRVLDHAARIEARPAVQRAVAREAQARALLEAEGGIPQPTRRP